jgi:hypothetical protein
MQEPGVDSQPSQGITRARRRNRRNQYHNKINRLGVLDTVSPYAYPCIRAAYPRFALLSTDWRWARGLRFRMPKYSPFGSFFSRSRARRMAR